MVNESDVLTPDRETSVCITVYILVIILSQIRTFARRHAGKRPKTNDMRKGPLSSHGGIWIPCPPHAAL